MMKNWCDRHDVFTKLLSVVSAIFLWCYIMGVENPTRTLEYRDIPVQLVGADAIYNASNLTVISGSEQTVNVRVSGSSSRLAQLTASQIKVRADLEDSISTPGTYDLTYEVVLPESGMSCVNRSPETISVTVDLVETKTVPVSVKLTADAPEGYIFEEPELTSDMVEITGPESALSKVTTASITIDTKNLCQTLTDNYSYKLVDKDGESVEMTNISRTTASVGVTIPVKQVKSVPLAVTFSPEGSGVDISATISPESVEIIGDPDTLKDIDSLKLGAINVTNASNGDVYEFDISLPTGVTLKDGEPTTANATVSIEDNSEKTYTITNISLNDTKKSADKAAALETESLDVILSGPAQVLDDISEKDISAVVEIASADLSAGQHMIGATISSPDGTTVVGTYSAAVRITNK